MFRPIDILPSRLGLKWNLSREQCLQALGLAASAQTGVCITVDVSIEGSQYNIDLLFNEQGGLNRIQVDVYESQSFEDEEYTTEELQSIEARFQDYYNRLVDYSRLTLGPPRFSGMWGSVGYPEDETEWQITYWTHPEGRLQIEFDQPDRIFPFVVRVVCYQVEEPL